MRFHTDTLTWADLRHAASVAQVELRATEHGSRSRDHAFEIALRGNSRRRPNFYNGDGSYAATWDQWGVFMAQLFERDADMLADKEDMARFDYRTSCRFIDFEPGAFPLDHDHTFRYAGVPYQQSCKCGATVRWDY